MLLLILLAGVAGYSLTQAVKYAMDIWMLRDSKKNPGKYAWTDGSGLVYDPKNGDIHATSRQVILPR